MTERYCNIRAESLEDILCTCQRHIKNAALSWLDMLDNGDLTKTDEHYLNMISGMWNDLHEDVGLMIKAQHEER